MKYAPGLEHPPSPDYVSGAKSPPLPDYVPGLEYRSYCMHDENSMKRRREEHLASGRLFCYTYCDPVPLADDTEAFETDESAPISPSPRPRRARISVRLESPYWL
ncbi:hypothetical protein Tco_1042476 [Tanacetum coccineum]|uniref:Uncharacterized protein n=1 Tax=Tanacetum coccineum TaxID=301880 RepID=A0ABQ5GJ72_9ASTR